MNLMARRAGLMCGGALIPNFIEIGNPNIVNGILYPSSEGGIRLPEKFPTADAESWEIYCEFVYSSRITTGYQTLFTGSDSPTAYKNTKYGIYLDGGMIRGRITDEEGTAVISPGNTMGVTQNTDTKIARLSYDGSRYRFMYNGTTKSGASSNAVTPQYLLIGFPLPFGGSINLKQFKIYKNGVIWWTPYSRR